MRLLIIFSGFNMAYDFLNHLYGGQLIAPKLNSETPLIGQMIVFQQENFQNPPASLANGDLSNAQVLRWISETFSFYNPTTWHWPTSGLFNFTLSMITEPFEGDYVLPRSLVNGFDDRGFIYFPSACTKRKRCPIHVALHGCRQGLKIISSNFLFYSII